MEVRDVSSVDGGHLREFLMRQWHADFVVAHDEPMRPGELPGFVALEGDEIVGHVAYRIGQYGCEIVAIAADPPRRGIGTALMDRAVEAARAAGCRRVWLTTTNDNVDAMRFYQRRGFRFCALRPGAVVEARKRWKPQLPPTGSYGITMRDELDLELPIEP